MQYTIEVQNNTKIFDGNEMQRALRTTFPVLLRKLYQDAINDKDNRGLTFFPEGQGNMVPTAALLNFSAVGLFLVSPALAFQLPTNKCNQNIVIFRKTKKNLNITRTFITIHFNETFLCKSLHKFL